MKTISDFGKFLCMCLVFSTCLPVIKAQTDLISRISAVTVYFEGAQIIRDVEFTAKKGEQTIMLDKLPHSIDPSTISVEVAGQQVQILSVKHNLNYLTEKEKPQELKKLEDSLKIYQEQLQSKNGLLQVFQEEEKMLLTNMNVRGDETGIQFEQLRNTVEFFRTRLTDVKNKQIELQRDISRLQKTIERINQQIQYFSEAYKKPYSQISIALSSQIQGKVKMRVLYVIKGASRASWKPYYDIRMSDQSQAVQLVLMAHIRNLTTENWDNVRLVLSTARTDEMGTVPQLYPWYIDYFRPETRDVSRMKANLPSQAYRAEAEEIAQGGEFGFASAATVNYTMLSVEYIVNNPYSIPSDGKEYQVFVKDYSIPVDFVYRTVPKLNPKAYLIAYLRDWSQYNLLSAEANVYHNNKFLNKTFIDASVIKDTFELSVGQDRAIVVERQLMKDYSKSRLVGNTQVVTRTYEITVKNTKNIPIRIEILDQVPLSNRKEIQIEFNPKDANNATYNPETGLLTWKLEVQQGETQKARFTYVVKYPKDWTINLQ